MTDDAAATSAGHEDGGAARTAGAGSTASTMPGWALPALYGAFVVSGAAGLTYELVWSRYLALLVGHSAYAQVLVIAVYLGGLAAGALAVGDRSRRLARPLLWYAGIETVLALAGLLYHPVFWAATELAYGTLFPALAGTGLLGPVKWGMAAALILPQSVLLGTTFPLMTAGTLRRVPERAGRTVALLYFANTIGGAAGLLLAGFGLIAWFAMPGTLVTAAVFNVLAAAAAFAVARTTRGTTEEWSPARARAAGAGAPAWAGGAALSRTVLWRVLLTVSFGTAVASFIYEIGWIRMLSLVMGSATHAFELMLSAFILGLAVGALWIRRAADTSPDPVRLLGWIQWGMGLAALATLPVYVRSFDAMAWLMGTVERTADGYAVFNMVRYVLALGVMLPSTVLAGMTLPLITAALLRAGTGERAIGWVYGVNTMGSVLGVAVAGLVLVPWLGLKNMLTLGASLDMTLGVGLLALASPAAVRRARWAVPAGLAALTAVVVVTVGTVELDRALLTSGVFRYGQVPDPEGQTILFYEDGRTATVSAHIDHGTHRTILSTNGKPDASLGSRWLDEDAAPATPTPITAPDEATQILAGLLPLAFVPDARSAAVIGHGSGITTSYLLGSPGLEEVTTIEIEPEMIAGSRVFLPANRRAFEDPRSRFVIDDAKAFFAYRRRRFDIITSEPSNPWVSGTAGLFSTEFYRRVRRYMAPGAVFVQWIQLYEVTDELILTVLAALHENFPAYRGFMVANSDLLIVASADVAMPEPDWSVLDYPAIARSLAQVPPLTPDLLEAMELFDRSVLEPVFRAGHEVNSDYDPVLDHGAERARFMDTGALGVYGLAGDRGELVRTLDGERLGFGPYHAPPVRDLPAVYQRARGNWIHAALEGRAPDLTVVGAPSRVAFQAWSHHRDRIENLEQTRPENWSAWIDQVMTLDHALHGVTAGVVDTTFYNAVFRTVERYDAPEPVRDAVDFLYGTAAWDFERVPGPAARIIARLQVGRPWINPGILLDGTVTALLALDRPEAALEALETLAPYTYRGDGDLRLVLLRAHIRAALDG